MPTRLVGCWRLRRPTRARIGRAAAKIGAMDRQTLRDWVHRFNAAGPEGLIDRKPAGAARRLTPEQEAELAALIEAGPDVERDGVVRWRCVDLQQLILTRWNIAYHERTIGKLLRRLGFRHMAGSDGRPVMIASKELSSASPPPINPYHYRGLCCPLP